VANPNGSAANIAGIYSKNKRILGMMPHPERATDEMMGGSNDGLQVLRDFLARI
jgi:phosphoribosylformylglycinamidine synthase